MGRRLPGLAVGGRYVVGLGGGWVWPAAGAFAGGRRRAVAGDICQRRRLLGAALCVAGAAHAGADPGLGRRLADRPARQPAEPPRPARARAMDTRGPGPGRGGDGGWLNSAVRDYSVE